MVEGVLYVARGDKYLKAAVGSARFVRRVCPGVAIAIASDGPVPAGFDQAVAIDEADGFRAKIVGMLASPFERTLFLDGDTYVVGDLSEVFRILDAFDIAAAHDPNRAALPLDDVPDSFAELNTGVIAYRRNDRVERLLHAWLDEYDLLLPQKAVSRDQPSFRRALYRATDVRPAVLPSEFNMRFWIAGSYSQPVRIIHGWASAETYDKVASLLNERVASRHHQAVVIGHALIDERAQVVGRFPTSPHQIRKAQRRAARQRRSAAAGDDTAPNLPPPG